MYDLLLEYQPYLDRYVTDLDTLTNYFNKNELNNLMMSIYSLIALILLIGMYANIHNKWIAQSEETKNVE